MAGRRRALNRGSDAARLLQAERDIQWIKRRLGESSGGSSAVDLSWSSMIWNDTSKIDGSGPRQEVKFALLDDLLFVSGIAFVNDTYDGDETLVKLPFDVTPFITAGVTLDGGFAITWQVNTAFGAADLRPGYARVRHRGVGFPVVFDDTGLYMSLNINGAMPVGGANVYIDGLVHLEGAP